MLQRPHFSVATPHQAHLSRDASAQQADHKLNVAKATAMATRMVKRRFRTRARSVIYDM